MYEPAVKGFIRTHMFALAPQIRSVPSGAGYVDRRSMPCRWPGSRRLAEPIAARVPRRVPRLG